MSHMSYTCFETANYFKAFMVTKKKKYTPKPIRFPSLITANNSFDSFENALERLLSTGETQVDNQYILIYKDSGGSFKSFTATLRVYITLIELYFSRQGKVYNSSKLNVLLNRLFEGTVLYEEEVADARVLLAECKQFMRMIKPSELMSMITTLRISSRINLDGTPESSLAWCKSAIGDIGENQVKLKVEEFSKLHLENPENFNYKRLADVYTTYSELISSCKLNTIKGIQNDYIHQVHS